MNALRIIVSLGVKNRLLLLTASEDVLLLTICFGVECPSIFHYIQPVEKSATVHVCPHNLLPGCQVGLELTVKFVYLEVAISSRTVMPIYKVMIEG